MASALPIQYRIQPIDTCAHLFRVSCTVRVPDPAGQRFVMPAWIPGSYMIRDFAKNIVQLWAGCEGRALAVRKLDKDTWQCVPCTGPLIVTYDVYAWDLSVRTAHLDTTHGYFNGTSVFFMVEGQRGQPYGIEIVPPEGAAYRHWRVATSLPRAGAEPYGFGLYAVTDYDELIDHPVEMGTFTLDTFDARGVPHDIAITGRHRTDRERLCRDLKALCDYQIRFFGEPAPMARYVFLVMAVGNGYGGLEHRASCSLLCGRDNLPWVGEAALREEYRSFLGLCSHEYFHVWNVKRILPAAFVPYDLQRENYTETLWVFEGITSYYQNLVLVRCGLITSDVYLELLARTITSVLRGSGRLKQSIAESSFDAWTKFYKADENAPNAVVSYYAKGALVALALDITLRCGTEGACSLDAVMRELWQRHGRTGAGVPEGAVEMLAQEISGLNLQDFFEQAVRGTQDLPLAELLAQMGVHYELRAAESEQDKGGKPAGEGSDPARRAVLGVRIADEGVEARIAAVLDGGAAQLAGLAAGDVVIAVDGIKVIRANLEKLFGAYAPGETVEVYAFRRDELMHLTVTLQPPPADTCVLRLAPEADAVMLAHRARWLGTVQV